MKQYQVFEVEHTDTFGGEANYAWVKRHMIVTSEKASDLALVRKAKKACGLNGVRSVTESYGDSLTIKPRGICQVVFVHFSYELTVEPFVGGYKITAMIDSHLRTFDYLGYTENESIEKFIESHR